MKPHVYALADCNNFYVSCERVFNPKLNGRPVIVLSNNDGCAVARSNEAKALGIKMAAPVFELRNLIQAHKIHVFSSNYTLYADMSRRVMDSLMQFTPNIEIYSIDEAFLELSDVRPDNLTDLARTMKKSVKQWTGIPISIGIASSKTLAKIANRIAKKSPKAEGVLNLLNSPWLDKALEITPVEDVWGIGRQYTKFLKARNIHNALQLKHADTEMIRKKMGVVGTRLLDELRGSPCYYLESTPQPRKAIRASRSFKKGITELEDLKEAIATFTSRATEKLRSQHSVTGNIQVFILTNRFNKESYYCNTAVACLPAPTADTSILIRHAFKVLEKIFRKGMAYKKAGVMLHDLSSDSMIQQELFGSHNLIRSEKLMHTLDAVNLKMGSDTLKFASAGLKEKTGWKTVFNHRSPRYTTNWDELVRVK